jgi:hypothetical protein
LLWFRTFLTRLIARYSRHLVGGHGHRHGAQAHRHRHREGDDEGKKHAGNGLRHGKTR